MIMHMVSALVAPAAAGAMYACSAAAGGYSVKKVRLECDPQKMPAAAVMTAFVFAAQMINFTIPGTGSSGHLSGALLLAAVLGPFAGFLSMIGILLVQCLLFADGGLLALGCNIWNMAFYGCFIGGFMIWRPMMRAGASKGKIALASIVGSIVTLQLGAFSVTLETLVSGITDLPFQAFVSAMQPIHLVIGLAEGLITAVVLCFVHEVKPEMLWGIEKEENRSRLSLGKTVVILAAVTIIAGGGLSLVSSDYPDGLEWSVERAAGDAELTAAGAVYESEARIQEMTAILPDYSFRNIDSAIGTSFSGIIGSLAAAGLCIFSGYWMSRTQKIR